MPCGLNTTSPLFRVIFERKVFTLVKPLILCINSYPGHYLYIESSYPARFGYKSQLMSKSFEPTEERCLSWWYNMYGKTVGSLNVYLINSHLGTRTRLWSKSGEQGKDWKQAYIPYSSESKYRVR